MLFEIKGISLLNDAQLNRQLTGLLSDVGVDPTPWLTTAWSPNTFGLLNALSGRQPTEIAEILTNRISVHHNVDLPEETLKLVRTCYVSWLPDLPVKSGVHSFIYSAGVGTQWIKFKATK